MIIQFIVGFFSLFLIDCKICFDPNKNVAVFLSSVSLCHLMQWNHSFSFFVPLTIYSVYLYMYEYKYIYTVDI